MPQSLPQSVPKDSDERYLLKPPVHTVTMKYRVIGKANVRIGNRLIYIPDLDLDEPCTCGECGDDVG